MKVFLAFEKEGFYAFTKGSSVLKLNSAYYKDFSLNIDQLLAIDTMIKLYLLFNKAETDKKISEDSRTPIPYYVLEFLGKEFKNMDFVQRNEKLKGVFANKQSMNMMYDFYKNLTSLYTEEYARVNGEEYNKMIKQEIEKDRIFVYNWIGESGGSIGLGTMI